MVRIRLQRHGRKRAPFYHIVAADSRKKRDGRVIERLGRYNPVATPATVAVDTERVMYWIKTGAQPSETVERLLRNEGIYYRLHLERWKKSPEEIEAAVSSWKEEKAAKAGSTVSNKEAKKAAIAAEEEAFQAEQKKRAEEEAKKAEEARIAKEKADAEAKAAAEAAKAEAEAAPDTAAEADAPAEETGDAPAEETKSE
ncbi:SSU ribosomal protein S16P [Cyclonatronum proteinivorum]|uniref:Small ribosomal subunit protein bS16 n=1 Tax=Cyclonatronum proteinivorum TaxID=1457365 RepID=A0A345UNJ3_9BACT|nr:30S ribosomal protein S16 [Cyclonatronum proteinivorum]AXJ02045.1 SSU ribosomal protein S16P [Cyclonatronum proteinivorum]